MGEVGARDLLMNAAEVLIGERGLTVSLREVAAAAEQRNTSAVIYHFGGLDGLIAATLERRMSGLELRRRDLLADLKLGPENDIHRIVRAIVAPAMTLPYETGATHYARFVEQIRTHAVITEAVPAAEKWPAVLGLTRLLAENLTDGSRRAQTRRIHVMMTAMFALMADYERRGELDSPRRRARASEELVALLVGLLAAPIPPSGNTPAVDDDIREESPA